MLRLKDVRSVARLVLGRRPSRAETMAMREYADSEGFDLREVASSLSSSSEVVHRDLGHAAADHLRRIHRARVGLMALLPPARRILDLGGANAPLCDAGYSHQFEELIIVDLPPEARHDEFAGRVVTDRQSPLGPVRVAYTSMTDLSMFESGSIDLVWSGQSVEHISVDDARVMYGEVRRVLRPDGWFCLDTPNRLLTRIHAEGGMIHPDHQHEYEPAELVAELTGSGFDVIRSLGVCDMPLTLELGRIDYRDFVVGAGLTTSVDSAYIQYHACRPRP